MNNNKLKDSLREFFSIDILLMLFPIFLFVKVISLFVHNDMWWDSSVYIGMGKYTYSLGKIGLWEPSRALVWPLILGFFWKIGLDYIFFGKLIAILFSLGSSVLVYIITLNVFDRKTALLTFLFFSFSPTYFLFNNILYSEMTSTFFLLLGIYFFIKKQHSYSGLFLGVAFMTRLFQALFALPILLMYVYLIYEKKESIKSLAFFCTAFLAPVIPYLILNLYIYKNPFHPFILQAFMTKYTGWIFHQPFYFYFINLIKENFLIIFSIIGIWMAFRNNDFAKKSIAIIFLFAFIMYNLAEHKEMRLLIPIFPFLYMLASDGIFHLKIFNNKSNNKNLIMILLLLLLWIFQAMPQLRFDRYDDKLEPFYTYVNSTSKNNLWISNPSFILHSNKKADELIYYPLYNSTKAKGLQAKLKAETPEAVLINTCDILPCRPEDDECLKETNKMIDSFGKKLRLVYSDSNNDCRYLIFEKVAFQK